jgi:hypothetical protein
MTELGLPSPEYHIGEAYTEVILRNDATRREAPTTGGVTPLVTTEFSNLYPLQGPLDGMTRAEFDQKRRALVDAFATKLRLAGWFIDRLQFGGLTAHRQGMPIHGPEAVARIVRIYPAIGCGFPMLPGLASRNNQAKTLGLPRRCDDFVILWVGV